MPTSGPAKRRPPSCAGRKGIIISGGPDSVYEAGSPHIDPAILSPGSAVLGICYGQQLMTYVLGGRVRKGEKGEYGLALIRARASRIRCSPSLNGGRLQVWMNHRDQVETVPPGFEVLGRHGYLRGGGDGASAPAADGRAVSSRGGAHRRRATRSCRTSSSASAAA